MPARTLLRATFYVLLALALSPNGLRAQLLVDCSGTNASHYPNINAALQQAGRGRHYDLVTGTCSETVNDRLLSSTRGPCSALQCLDSGI